MRTQWDESLATRVALCFVNAAIAHLEQEQGFSLPRSRRLSAQWVKLLGKAELQLAADLGEASPYSADTHVDAVLAGTDLLVSAFRESCSKAVLKDGSRDAALDCVIALALGRAHETCAAVDNHTKKGLEHGSDLELR